MRNLVAILFLCGPANAATWYAASDGAATNGTYAQPWSPRYAVTNGNPYLQAGDTVIFKNGSFTCNDYFGDPYTVSNSLMFLASGSAASPITYKAESLWGFTFDCGLLVPFTTSNLVLRELRVNTSAGIASRNKTNAYEMPAGMSINGSNVTVLHNLIENCGQPGIWTGHDALGKCLEGNIIRFAGYNDWSLTGGIQYSNAVRGCGFYMENSATPGIVCGNIVYYNYTEGLLLKNYVDDWRATNNIIIDEGTTGLLLQQKDNKVTAFAAISNVVFLPKVAGSGMTFGDDLYLDGGSGTGAVIQGNYIVGKLKGVAFYSQWKEVAYRTNTTIQIGVYPDGSSDQATEYNIVEYEQEPITNSPSLAFSGNSYFTSVSNVNNFSTTNTGTWAVYTNTVGDVTSPYYVGLPTSNYVQVIRPSSDSNFVHVAVANWAGDSTTSVDLSGYFSSGDKLDIYDAQNIPTAYATVNYAGGGTSLNLALTDKATMSGTFPNRTGTNAWTGFDSRFRAFVIHKSGTWVVPRTTIDRATIQQLQFR